MSEWNGYEYELALLMNQLVDAHTHLATAWMEKAFADKENQEKIRTLTKLNVEMAEELKSAKKK